MLWIITDPYHVFLLTGMIADHILEILEEEKILPDKQRGCNRGSRCNKDPLLIYKAVLKHTILSRAWIDYRKVYDLIPHS